MAQFHSVLTNYGVTAFAKAISTKQPLNILKMAVGDGNGRAVTPDSSRTALVREVYRANINSIKLDVRNNKQVIFELTIPEDVGGFYIREMGIFDHNEKLVAIANTPESYKPQLTEGSGKVQVLRMILLVSSSDSVSLTVDNSLIWAKRSELTPKDLDENSQSIIEENGHSHRLPIATLLKKGITKLFSGLDSDAEDMAATPKAIKILKGLIDAITRNLNNYIPNSKKSNAVDSNSADTVATSVAVKAAHDKALEAKSIAEAKQSPATTLAGYGIANAVETVDLRSIRNGVPMQDAEPYQLPLGAYSGLTSVIWVDGVRKFGWMFAQKGWGDSSGAYSNVRIAMAENRLFFQQAQGDNQRWQPIREVMASATLEQINLNDVLSVGVYGQYGDVNATSGRNYPAQQAGTLVVTPSAYGVQQEYTTYDSNLKYVRGRIHNIWQPWKRIDGLDKANRAGDTFTGTVAVREGDWSGIELYNHAGKYFRIETNPDHASHFGAFIYRNEVGSNEAAIYIPKKNGEMALIEDFSYQKIGNFEVRKYPDGTMIQTFQYEENDLYVWTQKEFSWAVAFTETPLVFSKITTSHKGSHDCGINILSSSNNAKVYYHYYEHTSINQRLCRIQFLSIGRWK